VTPGDICDSAVITNMEEPSKIYAAGSDRKIKEMTDAVITREVDVEGCGTFTQISQIFGIHQKSPGIHWNSPRIHREIMDTLMLVN
jgi:hypothetical protein